MEVEGVSVCLLCHLTPKTVIFSCWASWKLSIMRGNQDSLTVEVAHWCGLTHSLCMINSLFAVQSKFGEKCGRVLQGAYYNIPLHVIVRLLVNSLIASCIDIHLRNSCFLFFPDISHWGVSITATKCAVLTPVSNLIYLMSFPLI